MPDSVRASLYALLKPLRLYRLSGESRVDFELAAYLSGLEAIEQQLKALLRELHVQTAQGHALRLWEEWTGMPRSVEITPEQQREMILHRLSLSPGDFTPHGMDSSLRSAGLVARLQEEGPELLTVEVSSFVGGSDTIDIVKDYALAMLPAHVEVRFDVGIFTWEMFDANEWQFDTMDGLDFTWTEFDLRGQLLSV